MVDNSFQGEILPTAFQNTATSGKCSQTTSAHDCCFSLFLPHTSFWMLSSTCPALAHLHVVTGPHLPHLQALPQWALDAPAGVGVSGLGAAHVGLAC